MLGNKRPPIGLKPRFIHDEHRLAEIDAAILRFIQDNSPIPMVWITERDQLLEAIGARKR